MLSRTELAEHLYPQDSERDSNTIEVFVGRLQRNCPRDASRDRARPGLPAGPMATPPRHETLALRLRLLAGMLVWMLLTIAAAGWGLRALLQGMSSSSWRCSW